MKQHDLYPRILGLLTLGYGAYTALRPTSLINAVRLEPPLDAQSSKGRALGTAIGVRDTVSGISMLVAPPGPALIGAVAIRIGCDLADVAFFGRVAPSDAKIKVVGVAAAWALLCASSLPWAGARSRITTGR